MRPATPFLCLALALAGCTSTPAEPPSAPALLSDSSVKPARLVEDPASWPRDRVDVRAASAAGDTLEVRVRYGGGCVPAHTFELLISPVFMESYPVQVRSVLSHDAHGDACRALIEKVLLFDLTPLRDAYRDLYRIQHDTVHLWLGGLLVEYRF